MGSYTKRIQARICGRAGFTLVEILVVVGIIIILIALLVVFAEPVLVKVKEAQVMAHCKSIEQALGNYAASNNGLYPGIAIDINAPWPNYLLGDNLPGSLKCPSQPYAELYVIPGGDLYFCPHPAPLVGEAIVGGEGHMNSLAEPYGLRGAPVRMQIKYARDAVGDLKYRVDRRFDELVLHDCLDMYPDNPFRNARFKFDSQGMDSSRMINAFRVGIDMGAVIGTTDSIGKPAYPFWDYRYMGGNFAVKVVEDNLPTRYEAKPIPSNDTGGYIPGYGFYRLNWGSHDNAQHYEAKYFGIEPLGELYSVGDSYPEGDFRLWFAEGDFAYVPIFSDEVTPWCDNRMTQVCELFQFGSKVPGYMIFGYGSHKSKVQRYRDERLEFGRTGLPGYGAQTGGWIPGAPAIDTQYEFAVYNLFNGAIYYKRQGL